MRRLRVFGLLLGSLLASAAGGLAWADSRWRGKSRAMVARLRSGEFSGPAVFSSQELEGLPDPVARYFRSALSEGQPIVRFARFSQSGEFLVKPEKGGWAPFRADQHVATGPAGFVWDARIRMAPGIAVRVRDSFVEGEGSMVGSLLGIVPIVKVEGTPEVAAGALHRYLAEAAWFPTALLPSSGVEWTPLDDSSARATLRVGGTRVSVDFHFGEDGHIAGIFTPARARMVERRTIPTPWRGRFWDYEGRGGMRIPLAGEVEWLLPEGPQPYWRGRIMDIEYDFGSRKAGRREARGWREPENTSLTRVLFIS